MPDRFPEILIMDRENSSARGWSHVLSPTNDVAALDAFRRHVGAPPSALQLPPKASRPHLDICRGPRQRALALDGVAVRVFPTTLAMMRALRAEATARV